MAPEGVSFSADSNRLVNPAPGRKGGYVDDVGGVPGVLVLLSKAALNGGSCARRLRVSSPLTSRGSTAWIGVLA